MTESGFWLLAMKGLPWFRCVRRAVSVDTLDQQFAGTSLQYAWEQLKGQLEPSDRIWPFTIHVRAYLGMRQGYLVLRRGKPLGGIVTIVS